MGGDLTPMSPVLHEAKMKPGRKSLVAAGFSAD